MGFVDTHAHLDFVEDIEGAIERAKDAGVGKIITVGTSLDASRKCVEIADKYSNSDLKIYATVGIHPEDGKGDIDKFGSWEKCIDTLKQIVQSSKKVVGVGECGFDFYLRGDTRQVTSDTEKKFQKELFEAQIKLAVELKLPIVIHCRNAFDETFELLSTVHSKPLTGVFHSWTGYWQAAKRAIELGFYISFSGIVTFKNAPLVQEVAKKMPIARILIETDSPFLTPRGSPSSIRLSSGLRGVNPSTGLPPEARLARGGRVNPSTGLRVNKRNEPRNVTIVAEFIANLRNLSVDELAQVTGDNAGRLFAID